MASYLVGYLLAIAVVLIPVLIMGGDRTVFISIEGFAIVVGGTVAIALAGYPFLQIKHLLRVIFHVIRKEIDDGPVIAREVIELAMRTRGDRAMLQNAVDEVRYPFLKDGVELIVGKLDEDLERVLSDRIRTKQEEDESVVNMIRKLGSFPPALGLLATVLALVHLLQNMGGGGGMGNLGPTMAIGLVGTLYGIVTSNLLFAPMAENLAMKSALDIRNRQIAMLGILLLQARKNPVVIQEAVNSLLPVSKRIKVLGGGGS